jgi:hypothetical protein
MLLPRNFAAIVLLPFIFCSNHPSFFYEPGEQEVKLVNLRDFPGRPLLIQDVHSFVFQRVDTSSFLFSVKEKKNRLFHFLVRVAKEQRSKVLLRLSILTKFVQYVPHDVFLVALTYDKLKELSSMKPSTDIFKLPSRMKMWPELTKKGFFGHLNQRRRDGAGACTKVQLNVLLPAAIEDVPYLESEIEELCAESHFGNQSLCDIVSGSNSRSKLVLNTDECLRDLAMQRLAQHPAITWVEVRAEVRLRNKYATRILQSTNGSTWALWDKGLKGDGEVS